MYSRLQYVSQGSTLNEQQENIKRALDAGCEWIQLRFKYSERQELIKLGEGTKIICASYAATLIVNDDVEVAKQIDSDGLHLGLQDMPVALARDILGRNKIIGGTANTLGDVMTRIQEGCDYIGLGPFRFTSTKEKLSPVLGIEGYQQIAYELSKQKQKVIPVYAIGGIVPDDVAALVSVGIYGVAVSGAITNHSNKKEQIHRFNSLLYEKINHR